jgi:uncharacterized protein
MMHTLRAVGTLIALVLISVISISAAGGGSELVDAIKKGDKTAIRTLIRQRASVNAPAMDGTTALYWAVQRDDLDTTNLLIHAGANVNAPNRFGVTPLSIACLNANAAIVERLLKAGADANAVTGEGETALMTAARTGNVAAVKTLVAHGAVVNAHEQWRNQTALMWAAAEGHVDVMKALIELGADINARSNRGFTALLFAVRDGQMGTTRALLAAGVDVNEALPSSPPVDGETSPLMLAVMNAHFELANMLLEAGADPNADGLGYTALHLISWVRKPGSGAATPGPVGSGTMDSLALVRKLVAAGANPNARMTRAPRDGAQDFQSFLNWKGATPFLIAARSVDAPLMRLIAELGGNPLTPNEDNTTPVLVAAGIGVRSPTEDPGTEPEILDAVKLAIKLGGDINGVDNNGETVMHGAAVRGLNSLIELLIESGARIDVWNRPNKRGLMPLKMAEGHQKINHTFLSNPQVVPTFRQLIANNGQLPQKAKPE